MFDLGRNTSLLIAQAKANLLRRGKNPGMLLIVSGWLSLHFNFWGWSSLGNGGHSWDSL